VIYTLFLATSVFARPAVAPVAGESSADRCPPFGIEQTTTVNHSNARLENENESESANLETTPHSQVSPEAVFGSFVGNPSISTFQGNNASLDWIFFEDYGASDGEGGQVRERGHEGGGSRLFNNDDTLSPSPPQALGFPQGDTNFSPRGHLPTPVTNCWPHYPSTNRTPNLRSPLATPCPNSHRHSAGSLFPLDEPTAQNTGLTLPPLLLPTETPRDVSPTTSSIQDLIQARPSMIESLSIASRMSPWYGWNEAVPG
jgi:hypothetical protein